MIAQRRLSGQAIGRIGPVAFEAAAAFIGKSRGTALILVALALATIRRLEHGLSDTTGFDLGRLGIGPLGMILARSRGQAILGGFEPAGWNLLIDRSAVLEQGILLQLGRHELADLE